MRHKGVLYDVGRELYKANWRPDYTKELARRELDIIKNDLHCNAVKIVGRDVTRLAESSEHALEIGLDVCFAPDIWDESPEYTHELTVIAAQAAEQLRAKYPERVVFSVGTELTLFMKGILVGNDHLSRLENFREHVRSGDSGKALNAYLASLMLDVRKIFHGPVTYASLAFEKVDWSLFDIISIDHYWMPFLADRYRDILMRHIESGKPVVISEFGFKTYEDEAMACVSGGENVDWHSAPTEIPSDGQRPKRKLLKVYERSESLQAKRLHDQLVLLDECGVDGAFVFNFVFPFLPCDEEPIHDLDRASYSLVKTLPQGQNGTTYPDMIWEPKESFAAIAEYYAKAPPPQ